MKVIDFEKKGNVLRLYLGADNCNEYWGDDWNDRPYEHNAGTVYSEYVTGTVDIAMDFDGGFCEPADDWSYGYNSPYCKDDFKKGRAPCILVVPSYIAKDYWDIREYARIVGDKNIMKIYYNQPYNDEFKSDLVVNGCTIIYERLNIGTGANE